jgi:KUP system potassium uptake protein
MCAAQIERISPSLAAPQHFRRTLMTGTQIASEGADPEPIQGHGHTRPSSFWILALGSIGVVYGDIGTSPIYAFREAIKAAMGENGTVTEPIVFGILSLTIWALMMIVTVKYVLIILNADNRGEGGILSLMAIAQRGRGKFFLIIPTLGMIGAGLFYGDAMITPAIEILSAVEGLSLVTHAIDPYIVSITLFLIVILFAAQSRGTAKIALYFGPITLVWFAVLAVSGLVHIVSYPSILQSANPVYGFNFLMANGKLGLLTAGAVFLVVTGGEALYADLGHFGKSPIRWAWIVVVLPSLLLNYLGQGALLLNNSKALENPFFMMMPQWALLPVVVLATAATIIASQAVITGAFSLTRQAIQLGLLPRMQVLFTSASTSGQIYLPQVNWIVMVGVILLVLSFKSSSSLAAAYGIAVSGTMVVTTILAMFVVHNRWKWSYPATFAVMLPLLAIDVAFLGANSLKVAEGGWVPLTIGAVIFAAMWTWRKGIKQIRSSIQKTALPLKTLVNSLNKSTTISRVKGTAVYFTSEKDNTPTALLHSMKHFKVLHENNFILNLDLADVPYVEESKQITTTKLADGFWTVNAKFGYLDSTDIPKALIRSKCGGVTFDPMQTTYFLSHRSLERAKNSELAPWQGLLFLTLSRNADDASRYFQLPADRVVEVGTRQEL